MVDRHRSTIYPDPKVLGQCCSVCRLSDLFIEYDDIVSREISLYESSFFSFFLFNHVNKSRVFDATLHPFPCLFLPILTTYEHNSLYKMLIERAMVIAKKV